MSMSDYNLPPEYEDCKEWPYKQKIPSPLPWIGLYIALASLICFLAMAADTFCGIRSKRLWFPCRFFGLNAASLTLLGVAAKLTVDLGTLLRGYQDQEAKLGGITFMAIALGNFTTSLGSMDNHAILANVIALGIFIVTVIVNMWLFYFSNFVAYMLDAEYVSGTSFLLLLFITLVSCSLSVPTTKGYIEAKYQEKHQLAMEEEAQKRGKLSIKNLKLVIKRFWVMAATGNPQYVMARSALCVTTGSLCILSVLSFLAAEITSFLYAECPAFNSDYKWSTMFILAIQCLGVAVGIIPPTFRWFIVVSSKFSEMGRKSYKNELKIETFWTQRLEEWRGSSLPIQIQSIKCRKFVHGTKYLILSLCIKLQILIVLSSKFLLLFHVFSLGPFLLFLKHVKRFYFYLKHKSKSYSPTNKSGQELEPETELDLNRYVLLLEGEDRVPKKTLRNICTEVDRLILEGKKKQPKFLVELLLGDCSFNYAGVADFENDQIPSLQSQEPPGCWTLPIVTLTSIALALPNIEDHIADHLLRSVSEGLPYANLVQKCHSTSKTVEHIQNAADILWVRVELYREWLDQKLNNSDGSTFMEVLQGLVNTAEKKVMEFKKKTNGQMENPIYWPVNVIAANSMYRISKTMLLNFEGGNQIADIQLFKKLSDTIADVFAFCFTNLPGVITLKCQCDVIEERESSVRQAALLLGETEKILEVVEQRQLSGIVPDRVVSIDDWRVSVQQRNANAMAFDSASSLEVAISSN